MKCLYHLKYAAIFIFFCKEAINNAVKYSDGSLIELHVKETNGEIKFAIIDNGKGFDEISVRKGNGLNNMKNRAKEIGAGFLLKSNPGNGTRIELQYSINP